MVQEKKKPKVDIKLVLIILFLAITIILLNSYQESYLSLDNRENATLETITSTEVVNYTNPLTTPIPTNINTNINPPPSSSTGEKPNFLQYLPLLLGFVILALSAILFLTKRNNLKKTLQMYYAQRGTQKIRERRAKFEVQIRTLTEILEDYLKQERFRDGIIFGYHELDKNMRELLGKKREESLTPKEFAQSLELPEIISHLKNIVKLFYLARYRLDDMSFEQLKMFIDELKQIQRKTKAKIEIKKISREEIKDE